MVIALLFVIGAVISASWEAWPQTTIVGQNNPAIDVQAVQAAVEQGGTVFLKGTFDFGEKGSVTISKDVKIVGERDNQGIPISKIKGGFRTLLSPLPVQLPPQAPGPKIAIQNIHFDGTLAYPIYIAYCAGATIAGNKITNVRPLVATP